MQGADLLRFITRRKTVLVSLCVLTGIVLAAILAPLFLPYNPQRMKLSERLLKPNLSHWFGTDMFGRDLFSRVINGGRISLLIGMSASFLALLVGGAIGVTAGYFQWTTMVLMRLVDVFLAFPTLMLALAFMAIWGRGLFNVVFALGIVYAVKLARVAYSSTLAIREAVYVEGARAIGAHQLRIVVRYVLPNIASILIVQTTFNFGLSILWAASLSFLGVGIPPDIPSWGTIINEAQVYIVRAPWLLAFPACFIILSVLALNVLGDALRDYFDPRFREAV